MIALHHVLDVRLVGTGGTGDTCWYELEFHMEDSNARLCFYCPSESDADLKLQDVCKALKNWESLPQPPLDSPIDESPPAV